MDQKWKIDYYKTLSNKSPVEEFLDSLNAKAKSKVINSFDLLEEFGTAVGPPKVKKIQGTQLWELRILGFDNIRIFYVAKSGKSFLLLHGFVKKNQKTDTREIKTALERLKDHNSSL